ncbi:SdpI family protein [Lewinella sp. IMCC34191]|uniref:SdpI family protein n=1 Tax=Lewinella sp. IMCC34191 TaxID=2259172 RepID=UPI000E239AA3|nr:SdpI family protein [Lewinella sp. IMCC34191]
MSKSNVSQLLWITVAIPFLYLAYVYPTLPEEVPIRFGPDGQPVAYGPKAMLWLLPIAGPLLMAVIYSFVLPEATFSRRPRKLWWMVLLTTALLSALMVYIIQGTSRGQLINIQVMFFIIGGLLIVIGNFMPVIPPNRWIGIRLPITLRDDEAWWRVHRFSGPLWVMGGALIIAASLFVSEAVMPFVLVGTVLTLAVGSTVYAYRIS